MASWSEDRVPLAVAAAMRGSQKWRKSAVSVGYNSSLIQRRVDALAIFDRPWTRAT